MGVSVSIWKNNWDEIKLIEKLILILIFFVPFSRVYNFFFMEYYKDHWLEYIYGTPYDYVYSFVFLTLITTSSYFMSKILINLGTEKNYFKPSFSKILWLLFVVVIVRVVGISYASSPAALGTSSGMVPQVAGHILNIFFFPLDLLDFYYGAITRGYTFRFMPYFFTHKGYLGYILKNMPVYFMISCFLYYKLHNRFLSLLNRFLNQS